MPVVNWAVKAKVTVTSRTNPQVFFTFEHVYFTKAVSDFQARSRVRTQIHKLYDKKGKVEIEILNSKTY